MPVPRIYWPDQLLSRQALLAYCQRQDNGHEFSILSILSILSIRIDTELWDTMNWRATNFNSNNSE